MSTGRIQSGFALKAFAAQACEAKLSAKRQENGAKHQNLEEPSAFVVEQQEILNCLEGQAVASSPPRTGRCARRKSLSRSLLKGGRTHARHALGHLAKSECVGKLLRRTHVMMKHTWKGIRRSRKRP